MGRELKPHVSQRFQLGRMLSSLLLRLRASGRVYEESFQSDDSPALHDGIGREDVVADGAILAAPRELACWDRLSGQAALTCL